MKTIPKLYFVTPEIGEDFEKWKWLIEQVVAGGIEMIQIRDKRSSKQRLLDAAKEIQPLLKRANIPMIINDYVDVALKLGADGIHLGQSDLKVAQARAILGYEAIIGLSVETRDQAIEAKNEQVTYLAASPVLTSNTKNDCGKPWGIAGLKELCLITHHPIFAIGGIDLHNIEQIVSCGVAGVAVVSAIAKAISPKVATEELLINLREYAYSRMG